MVAEPSANPEVPTFDEVMARLAELPAVPIPPRTGERLNLIEPPHLTAEEMAALGAHISEIVSPHGR